MSSPVDGDALSKSLASLAHLDLTGKIKKESLQMKACGAYFEVFCGQSTAILIARKDRTIPEDRRTPGTERDDTITNIKKTLPPESLQIA